MDELTVLELHNGCPRTIESAHGRGTMIVQAPNSSFISGWAGLRRSTMSMRWPVWRLVPTDSSERRT